MHTPGIMVVLMQCIQQPQLSELARARQDVQIIESSHNQGCLLTYAYTQGPRQSTCLDNQGFALLAVVEKPVCFVRHMLFCSMLLLVLYSQGSRYFVRAEY